MRPFLVKILLLGVVQVGLVHLHYSHSLAGGNPFFMTLLAGLYLSLVSYSIYLLYKNEDTKTWLLALIILFSMNAAAIFASRYVLDVEKVDFPREYYESE